MDVFLFIFYFLLQQFRLLLKLCTGAVVESKAQLVGIHERVRSDFAGNQPPTSIVTSTAQGGKRLPTATNPSAEDAAELLRLLLLFLLPTPLFV